MDDDLNERWTACALEVVKSIDQVFANLRGMKAIQKFELSDRDVDEAFAHAAIRVAVDRFLSYAPGPPTQDDYNALVRHINFLILGCITKIEQESKGGKHE